MSNAKRDRELWLFLTVTALLLWGPVRRPSAPLIIYNASPSMPVGFYRIIPGVPLKGEAVLVRMPKRWRAFMKDRSILPAHVPLLKTLAATYGDRVCRQGRNIFINGCYVASARTNDLSGPRLPQWQGCMILSDRQLFLLSKAKGSFDSRYFGVVPRSSVIGVAVPVWVKSHSVRP